MIHITTVRVGSDVSQSGNQKMEDKILYGEGGWAVLRVSTLVWFVEV